MRRTSLNESWSVRPRQSGFSEMGSGAPDWIDVTLPHDALISTERSDGAGPATGYFPTGVVRPTGSGTILVTATADGCEPRRLSIEAR